MRPSKHHTFMDIANVLAKRTTCVRRAVGCVLVNKQFQIIGTGYNGVAAGQVHCLSKPCAGANSKSGENLHQCEAVHAEQNALMQCSDVSKVYACYVTTSPCMHCMKMLLNTSCEMIFFDEMYDFEALNFWRKAGRKYFQIGLLNEPILF